MKTPEPAWRSLPPTEKQLAFIRVFDNNIPQTRGEACDKISSFITTCEEQASRYRAPPSDYGMPLRGDMAQHTVDCMDYYWECDEDDCPF